MGGLIHNDPRRHCRVGGVGRAVITAAGRDALSIMEVAVKLVFLPVIIAGLSSVAHVDCASGYECFSFVFPGTEGHAGEDGMSGKAGSPCPSHSACYQAPDGSTGWTWRLARPEACVNFYSRPIAVIGIPPGWLACGGGGAGGGGAGGGGLVVASIAPSDRPTYIRLCEIPADADGGGCILSGRDRFPSN